MKQGLSRAFQNLLIDSGQYRASCENLEFSKLSREKAKGLEVSFIEATLKELNGDKVPGLDSCTIAF